jgi:cytochrome c oxidase accessory protein FixG
MSDSPDKVHLRVYEQASSLRADGSRNYVHPADVTGRFDRRRKLAFTALVALLVALPWIEVGGRPAVFLDFQHRSFYLFGGTFNAQDTWMLFFLLSGIGFALISLTALFGRIWCGYACPQTVFLEGIFRPIERLLEGPRNERLHRNAGPLSWDKLWRKTLKHAVFLVLAFLVAHIIVSYFVSLPGLYAMVLHSPAAHPEAFVWATGLTLLVYFDMAWFREQMCLIICPYGRLQSVLTDKDTLVIGYDGKRGEPRGKASVPDHGDCVDCNRCVVVCPTGIDIRNGLQLDCVGCARCVDACDEIMHKLGRPAGLVRYDSQAGLSHEPKRFLRPRVYLYGVLGVMGIIAVSTAVARSQPFEANLLRLRGAPPFIVDNGHIRNAFEVHVVNKRSARATFELRGDGDPRLQYVIGMPKVELAALQDRRIPVFVQFERGTVKDGERAALSVVQVGGETVVLQAPLLGPH